MPPQDNRYAPPRTQELELPADGTPDRCEHVEWTRRVIWGGVGVSLLASLLMFVTKPDEYAKAMDWVWELIGLGIGLAIAWWFTNKLGAGRNWMRLLITILNSVALALVGGAFAIMLPTASANDLFGEMFKTAPIETGSMMVQMLLIAVEIVLLNTPSSRAWFKAKKYSA